MVSFWPWKGDDNSPSSFEKTLSTLSTKIAQATTRLDQQRQTARRFKALWTLYSTFAYLFYSIVLALVLGWESWGSRNTPPLPAAPFSKRYLSASIYAVRTFSSRMFEYRISRSQRHLDDLNRQRDQTIEKLKVATKYDSTQQLLERYGGELPKLSPSSKAGPKQHTPSQKQQQRPVARTGLPPPPTANIRRPAPDQPPVGPGNTPSPLPYPPHVQQQPIPNTPHSPPPIPQQSTDEPGFAPNAFPNSGQYIEQPHWYDRLLDVLLGEDEMHPRNRMAMICGSCRLVNGQVPPGIKTLEELGRWRCGSCGAWNGEESETVKILSSLRQADGPAEGTWEPVSTAEADPHAGEVTDDGVMVATGEEDEQDVSQESDEVENSEADEPEEVAKAEPVRRSKRGKAKQ
ncbi:uncharacterized protein N7482_009084 [Penicillium canariense]|uniref:Endoplasmic reticulum junction formation protein lunapark n=1 Tax=Penicillium canariense TaxID=189055 RepID=A0A9W9HN85_9EURO|nr:uncharacterized protein N7482_009084 [Penicillium canariense]KAJ5152606.1 hypothetical protein N7482_009084 [Penicillium canariense]